MKILYAILFLSISLAATATAPTVPASNLHFNTVDGEYLNLGWTNGNGARRIIICRANNPVSFVPQNGVDYVENTVFGSGQEVAPGEFVIYDNVFTSFYLTGLNPSTQYFFAVFDYNGTGGGIEYLTSSFLSGSASTSAPPTLQATNPVFSNITTNSATITWTNGNGARRLVLVREGSPVNGEPTNSQAYNANSAFGSGASVGTGNYSVYAGSGNSVTVTNLVQGAQYFFAIFEFNGSGQPQYLTPAVTANVTTRSIPTVASSNVVITKTDGQELSLAWTNGNGQRRIIVARQGSNITSVPVSGIDYNANSVFGTGQQLAAGEYVVYDDNFNAATISGLNPSTTYYFRIFEYDGSGSTTSYLTSSYGSVSGPTAITPTQQSSGLGGSNPGPTSFTLSWTSGNGRARLVVGRKNMPVSFVPQDFTSYSGNSDFGQGQDLGNGQFVLASTTELGITVHQLEPNSTYYFGIFEYNGFNQPLYMSPAASFNFTTSPALPVKLLDWEAHPQGNQVRLQWTTASEINASHFVVEKSADGVLFTAIATVLAAGNSQSDKQYAANDPTPFAGKSYYRLKSVDVDGKAEYSAIRSVLFSAIESVVLLGNPVTSKLEFLTAANILRCEWQILNMAGQVVLSGASAAGRTELNVSTLPAGQYWLRLVLDGKVQVKGFIRR